MRFVWLAIFMALLTLAGGSAAAQAVPRAAPTEKIAVALLPSPATSSVAFNADKATKAYLARISGAARARSDAYFEGGYWLILIDLLYTLAVAALLLWSGASAKMRNWAAGLTRSRFVQAGLYIVPFFLAVTVLEFPLAVYEGFLREHAYGLSNQNFLQWLRDFAVGDAVQLIAFVVLGAIIYAIMRARPRSWWLWGAGATIGFMALGAFIAPVFIMPLFNTYTPMAPSPLKSEIVSLAQANGIPATGIYVVDASRQSKRISANVSGFAGTTRISLNDNLLHRADRREILAVLGHEMGHYVLDHSALLLTWMGLVYVVGFAFVAWGFGGLTDMFGGSWQVRDISDPAGLPVLMALFALFMTAATPVTNTITRTAETQADIFGLNAARQPDGFAEAALQLSEYRKLDPGKWEEIIFYDHPSGRSRILMAMRWKAAHIHDYDIEHGPVSPQ